MLLSEWGEFADTKAQKKFMDTINPIYTNNPIDLTIVNYDFINLFRILVIKPNKTPAS